MPRPKSEGVRLCRIRLGPRPVTGPRHCLLLAVVSHASICIRTSFGWSLVERKKPRNIYLGGRTKVYHLLLVGRYREMTYKQRVQTEGMIFRRAEFFLPRMEKA